jgi:outer membrane protein OmpA-like peptidoglycan-associated protein
LPIKGKPGQVAHVCVNGVVTWTPGDVVAAEQRGGLVSIVSTKEYASQMPNVIIGVQPFMKQHPELVEGMISAVLEGGRLVKGSRAALERAAEVSDEVYQEKNTGKEYWLKYFAGRTTRDRQGLQVELGGSKVNDLSDNVALFGLRAGYANAFEATYTTFGRIVHDQYPDDVPTFPAASAVVNTSYLKRVLERSKQPVTPQIETASYTSVTAAGAEQLGSRSWQIQFDTGRDSFRPEATAPLTELMQGLVVAAGAAIEVHGHTDNQGEPAPIGAAGIRREGLAATARPRKLSGVALSRVRAWRRATPSRQRQRAQSRPQPPREHRAGESLTGFEHLSHLN